MAPESFLRELQKNYLKLATNGYGEKVSHSEMASGFSQCENDPVHYYQEIERMRKTGEYRFKILIDDEAIAIFEPFF